MQIRTDLAIEAGEGITSAADLSSDDILRQEEIRNDAHLTRITIRSEQGARQLGRPRGVYVTVEVPPLSDNDEQLEEHARLIGEELRKLLPAQGTILVAGLGNESITPDALGPRAAQMVLATRHIEGEFARSTGLDDLRPTAVTVPGVLGQTGVESGEIIRGVCSVVKPAAVIIIDALAARSTERLGCTAQLCDTGIAPGSGVGNNRPAITEETLGIPVIGMGVPTVVDARTVAMELTGREEAAEEVTPRGAQMMVTPREIDLIIRRASRLVAMAINAALQPEYSPLSLVAAAI
ncbi:MAG: GPR endopeptidase [Clostridiales bacterium]|nr:GPR endopeptidase [Clostridiales bacterium]